jgi:signal transduction histidine kinase
MMRSLAARLFAAALVSVTLALVLTWLALTQLFANIEADEYQRELQAAADTIISNMGVSKGKLTLNRELTDARYEIAAGGRYWQIDSLSGFSKRSRSLWDIKIATTGKLKTGSSLLLADGPAGEPMMVLSQEATLERGTFEYPMVVQVAADLSEYTNALANFQSGILKMLILTGLFLLAAAALQIFVGLQPLFNVRKAVNALRQGHVSQIAIKGPEEVRPLISEINTLMADNQAAVTRARARASDLAHGLKTPLTILAQIGETLKNSGDSKNALMMEQQVTTIRSRVDRQLALARAGNPNKAAIDLKLTLDRLINATQPLLDRKNIAIEASIPTGLLIAVDATDFLEAVGNIVDNAVRHARTKISISATKNSTFERITVNDDGPGILESERNAALERGRRLDETGDGTGLGLSISKDILDAYGGSISLGVSDMGGLSVAMDWPRIPN